MNETPSSSLGEMPSNGYGYGSMKNNVMEP